MTRQLQIDLTEYADLRQPIPQHAPLGLTAAEVLDLAENALAEMRGNPRPKRTRPQTEGQPRGRKGGRKRGPDPETRHCEICGAAIPYNVKIGPAQYSQIHTCGSRRCQGKRQAATRKATMARRRLTG
jgi:hypothetical protein